MKLDEISFVNFRNLQQQSFSPCKNINFIIGKNGSGKSSILEGIYYLARGRSFRTSQVNKIITQGEQSFVLFSEFSRDNERSKIGIKRGLAGALEIKIDGEKIDRLTELASRSAVQVVTPDSFNLFFGGPKVRRQFIDFGLFHVEHAFYEAWINYSKLLKNRNALLKQKVSARSEYVYWDEQLAHWGEKLSLIRKAYTDLFTEQVRNCFEQIISDVDYLKDISLTYYQGWSKEYSLLESLQNGFDRDIRYGHTQSGPHKADLKVSANGHAVQDLLSRGQLKLLLYVFKIVQSKMINSKTDQESILLFDDLPSEVDDENKKLIAKLMEYSASQVFVTCIDQTQIADIQTKFNVDCAMFHVEHGQIRA